MPVAITSGLTEIEWPKAMEATVFWRELLGQQRAAPNSTSSLGAAL